VDLAASNKTDFTRIFAGQGGIARYSSAASDVYQDLFGEGSFTGKGLIDVDAYLTCLDTRFPDNTVLSHDLREGASLHCTYAGDTELTDGYPARITSYYDRLHRWTRGDWQAAPWLFRSVKNSYGQKERNVFNQISRWKLFDNLRRSLVPVFTFSALMAGLFSASSGFIWAASISVLAMVSNLVISSAEQMFRRDPGKKARYYSSIISGFGAWLLQMLTRILVRPFEAWTCVHAVVTARYRMIISHKKRLSWVTAADSERNNSRSVFGCFRKMSFCVLTGAAVLVFSPFASADALAIIWILSPLYAYSLGRDLHRERKISPGAELFLKRCAGDIWKYFEEFITAEDHYLPPDNWQEQPAVGPAHRTSPTNIGLALLSSLAAIDLGLSTSQNALGLIENMLTTMDRLPKWHGHLYNCMIREHSECWSRPMCQLLTAEIWPAV
jgi:cyclic beta-1,2-glucan synthetase